MRLRVVAFLLIRLGFPCLFAFVACKARPEAAPSKPPRPQANDALDPLAPRPSAAPLSSAVVAFEKALQATKLPPPARRTHASQLAFGKGVLGQLTAKELRVFDEADFALLATEPLDAPRAIVALADGSLLAIGARGMLHWQREKKHATSLSRPVLLPGAQLYADAQRADRFWVADVDGRGNGARLDGYSLKPSPELLLLPELSIELTSARGGVFGVTREGTWLYLTQGHGERLAPGGLRLSGLAWKEATLPTWVLPALRLDQSLWLDDSGQVSLALVSPSYKYLAGVQLPGRVVDADVGDEGRLLAAVVATGEGPRFELLLLDHELEQLARQVLPADAPTGNDDWAKAVTENQTLAVARREGRVAVGGPGRVTIFDAEGKQVFSIPSR